MSTISLDFLGYLCASWCNAEDDNKKVRKKNVTCPVTGDAGLVHISDAVNIGLYDRGLQCSRSYDSMHMRRRSTAAAVQHGGPFGKLVWLGSPRFYAASAGTECAPVFLALLWFSS
jgi:hypothetical protein